MIIPKLIESNKYIFGTYSVMALLNIQTVLDHIKEVVNLQLPALEKKPEDLWKHPVMNYLRSPNVSTPEITTAITDKLFQSFPFLKVMAEHERDYQNKKYPQNYHANINEFDIYKALNKCFRVVKRYRDYTTHYIISMKNDDSWEDGSEFMRYSETPLSHTIHEYYTVALRNLQSRYNYSTADLAFIQDYRYKRTRDKNGKPSMVKNLNFFLSMQSDNGDKIGKLHLSAVGVVQLICLFLEKKYANIFLSKLHIADNYPAESNEAKIIKRSFCINSVVLPKERIQCSKKSLSIAMDMLNELKKCPKELFDTLSNENQEKFRITSSDFSEVALMRSTDRFAQLLLEYIDSNKLFDTLRFQVNMGKLRYLFNPEKICIDGETRVRVLEEPLNGFGRLDEMEEYRTQGENSFGDTQIPIRTFENVKRDDANPENYPYVVDTYSRYLLDNNKINICFKKGIATPTLEKSECDETKWYVDKFKPHCSLSVFELPAMAFHMHLYGARRTEQHIFNIYKKYKALFTDLENGVLTSDNIESYGIALVDMPKKVLEAINGQHEGRAYREYIEKEIRDSLNDTMKRIERIKNDERAIKSSDNKMGKRGFKQIKPGKLAEFLAEDIVKFQPSRRRGDMYGTDRLTGMNYRVMQATIATFNSATDENAFENLKNLFRNANLIDGRREVNHPFLGNVMNRVSKNTVELYKAYLKAKERYLNKLIEQIEDDKDVSLPYINRDSRKWAKRDADFYKELGENYMVNAVELPRQMFDAEIKEALKKKPSMSGVDFDNANVTYLIGEYLKRERNDDFQEFYTFARNYRYIDMLKCEVEKNKALRKNYTTIEERESLWANRASHAAKYSDWAKRKMMMQRNQSGNPDEIIAKRLSASRNDYQKSEKNIRRYKVQDALLFMLVCDTLKAMGSISTQNFKLKDIMPNAEKGILSKSIPMDFTFEKEGKTYTIHSDNLKLKNYGDFFAIARDKRFIPLLNILNSNVVNKDDVSEEFNNYDDVRPNLVKLVIDFEKMAYKRYPELKNKIVTHEHFDFSVLLNELIAKGNLTENDTYILSQIRNAFSHNSYPYKGVIRINTLPEIAEHLIELFGEYAEKES